MKALGDEMWSLLKFSRSKFLRISIWYTELLPAFYSIFLDRKLSKDSKFRYKRTECFLFDLLMVRCLHSLAVFDFSRKFASGKFQKTTPSHDRVLSSEKKLFFQVHGTFETMKLKKHPIFHTSTNIKLQGCHFHKFKRVHKVHQEKLKA